MVGLAVAGIVMYLPFYLTFDSQTSGILPVAGPATRPVLFMIVMGVPAILAGGFVARAALDAGWPTGERRGMALLCGSFAVGWFVLWLVAIAVRVSISPDGLDLADNLVIGRVILALPLLLMGGLAAYCALALSAQRRPMHWVVFALALAAVGFFLLGGAELFHIADQFGNRMNTVFKFYYQAWLMLGIAGAIGMYYILAAPLRHAWVDELALLLDGLRVAWVGVVALLLMASAYYPAAALVDRTGWASPGESVETIRCRDWPTCASRRPGNTTQWCGCGITRSRDASWRRLGTTMTPMVDCPQRPGGRRRCPGRATNGNGGARTSTRSWCGGAPTWRRYTPRIRA